MRKNKDNEKLKDFKKKVNKPTDMFGVPQEIPVAKDATFVKPPISGYEQAESNSDQTTGGRMLEQIGQGLKYVGKKTLEGMANAVEGF
jgi:hypothetical protein